MFPVHCLPHAWRRTKRRVKSKSIRSDMLTASGACFLDFNPHYCLPFRRREASPKDDGQSRRQDTQHTGLPLPNCQPRVRWHRPSEAASSYFDRPSHCVSRGQGRSESRLGSPELHRSLLRRLQSLQSIWQLAAFVLPPWLHGVMWSASMPSKSKGFRHFLHSPFWCSYASRF